jgi:hypothetical protein
VRGCRPNILKYLLLDIDDSMQVDHALATNDNDESTLLIAERDNISLFKICQNLSNGQQTASDIDLETLDRSNQIIAILLNLMNSTQMNDFQHVHECFRKGMNFATWYEERDQNRGYD